MDLSVEDITQKALGLTHRQRLALAGFLLEIDGNHGDPEINDAWEKEIQSRIQAIDTGSVAGISYHDVMREAEQRLAP